MEKPILTHDGREARNRYMREYRRKNKIKSLNAISRYWERQGLKDRIKKEDQK